MITSIEISDSCPRQPARRLLSNVLFLQKSLDNVDKNLSEKKPQPHNRPL